MLWALSLQNIQNDKETEWGLDIERPFGFPARTEQPDIDQNVHLKFYYVFFFMCFFSVELLLPMFWIFVVAILKAKLQGQQRGLHLGIRGHWRTFKGQIQLLQAFYNCLYLFIFRYLQDHATGVCLTGAPTSTGFTMFHMHASFAQVSWPSCPVQ